MSEFKKYQHLERLGNVAVEGILDGTVHIFPKLDGTNGSIWFDKETRTIKAGSRNRELELGNDNHGFYAWACGNDPLRNFIRDNQNVTLYGEWLVPHTIKDYEDSAWRRFYIFDVVVDDRYVPYDEYVEILSAYSLDVVPCVGTLLNPTETELNEINKKYSNFQMKEGNDLGEGIVLKNYEFINRFGRTTWAKIINHEFTMKAQNKVVQDRSSKSTVELKFATKAITTALIDKTKAKIEADVGYWDSKLIPRLLNTLYYDIVTEELWDFIKKNKMPKIDFKQLNKEVSAVAKVLKPEYF